MIYDSKELSQGEYNDTTAALRTTNNLIMAKKSTTPLTAKKRKALPEPQPKKKKGKCAKKEGPAKDAILNFEMMPDDSVVLTMAPGWEVVLPQEGDDDPGCLIMWNDTNCLLTVAAFNAAFNAPGTQPPTWLTMNGGGPMTLEGLKAAILNRVDTTAGGGGVVGNALIAPNTVEQSNNICTAFGYLGVDPFFVAHAVCPLGRHFILKDKIQNNTGVPNPILPPPVGQGVAVFAEWPMALR